MNARFRTDILSGSIQLVTKQFSLFFDRAAGMSKSACVLGLALLVSSCTSSKVQNASTSSNYNKTTLPIAEPAPVIKTAEVQSTPLAPAVSANGQPVQVQAEVQVQPQVQPPIQPQIQTLEGNQPVIANAPEVQVNEVPQTQVASLQSTQPTPLIQPQPQTRSMTLGASSSTQQPDNNTMAFADPNAPEIVETPEMLAQQRVDVAYSAMTHASCKGGWAKPPDKLDASRVTLGQPYYMEMRLRHTPLLPVGHTYIAYGRMGEDGTLLNENVVMLSPIGGYGGAALAAAVPIKGILKPVKDDCRIKPHAAYRVSLTAIQFEKLLERIKKAQEKIPAYALFAYNCNHFASDIAASVGILPPKNIYLPAIQYIYGVIEANEGYNPKKRYRRRS